MFGSWILIRIEVKIQKLKMETWRAVDACNGSPEAQNGSLENLEVADAIILKRS
jgi:hypothetical protein